MNVRIQIAFTLVFLIWHFVWVCSLFFLSSIDTADYGPLILSALAAWTFSWLLASLAIFVFLRMPLKVLGRKLPANATPEQRGQLQRALERFMRLPEYCVFISAVAWWFAGFIVIFLWSSLEVGSFASNTLWVGQIAGFFAIPVMMLSLTAAIAGLTAERFTTEALRHGLQLKPARTGITQRLIISFLSFAVGLSVWLGGFGFYANHRTLVADAGERLVDEQQLAISLAGTTATSPTAIVQSMNALKRAPGPIFAHWLSPLQPGPAPSGTRAAAAERIQFNLPRLQLRVQGQSGSYYDSRTATVFAWSRLPDSLAALTPQGQTARLLLSASSVDLSPINIFEYMIWLGVFILAAMFVAPTMAIGNASIIKQGLRSTYAMVKNLGDGNLAVRRGAPTLDESGMLTIDLNRILRSLNDLIVRVRQAVENVGREFGTMQTTAQNLANGAQAQAAAVEQASASMEEVSASTKEISTMVDDQAGRVHQLTTAVDSRLSQSIERVAERASSVNNTAAESEQRARDVRSVNEASVADMQQIRDSSNDILSIVDVIVSISEKTNLLALNASIEAARAGEAGRGFAVVADEVSRLAEQSNRAIAQIKQLVDVNNNRVSRGTDTVASLASVVADLEQSARVAREIGVEIENTTTKQRETGAELRDGIREMETTAQRIAQATGEQSSTAVEMANTLEQINEVAQSTAGRAESMAGVINELQNEFQALGEITDRFIVRGA